MREYIVKYTNHGVPCEVSAFAVDRRDAMRFVTRTYRGSKVKSARMLNKKETNVAPVTKADEDMLAKAKDQVKANAHSGRAIGQYLRQVLATALCDAEIRRVCEWIVRQVEDRDATSKVIKR